MGKPTGFLEYERETAKVLPPKVRIANFKEFRTPLNKEKQKLQGARCMACGVPFCQSGMMIGGMASGCPLHNLVPETNDLVYTGNWKQAFLRLSKTHSFPEFTSRVCPALCEAACTCNLNGEPVSTKENERAIIETAYENGNSADPGSAYGQIHRSHRKRSVWTGSSSAVKQTRPQRNCI
jgi:glutamate synthase (NADPH/NADH) small chain